MLQHHVSPHSGLGPGVGSCLGFCLSPKAFHNWLSLPVSPEWIWKRGPEAYTPWNKATSPICKRKQSSKFQTFFVGSVPCSFPAEHFRPGSGSGTLLRHLNLSHRYVTKMDWSHQSWITLTSTQAWLQSKYVVFFHGRQPLLYQRRNRVFFF